MRELLDIIEHNLMFCEVEREQGCNMQRLNQLDGMIIAYKNVIKLIKYLWK